MRRRALSTAIVRPRAGGHGCSRRDVFRYEGTNSQTFASADAGLEVKFARRH